MRQPKLYIMTWILFLLFFSTSFAGVRLSVGGGIGSFSTKNEISKSEGPLGQFYSIDYLLNSKVMVGAEHIRSFNLSPLSSGISFTGLYYRYYLNSASVPYYSRDEAPTNEVIYRDLCYFVGTGFGVAQSSLPVDDAGLTANAAGFYISPQAGGEMFLTKSVGIRSEIFFSTIIFGKGSISAAMLLGTIFFSF